MNGYRGTLETILSRNGMRTRDAIGTVWAVGDTMWKIITTMGFRVEQGISNPTYDYIIISQKKSTLENVLWALTKLNVGGIIVFRHYANTRLEEILEGFGYNMKVYQYNKGLLGVIVKQERR